MQIWECETLEDYVTVMQRMINDGSCWKMEGSIGRMAMDYIHAGLCVLGEEGHSDYYGNYVPSRTEVEEGAVGSIEYQQRMQEGS
jgi:hypothetical protein